MFEEHENFIYIKSGKRRVQRPMREYLEHHGKYLIYGTREKVNVMASVLKGMVGRDGITEAKFARNPEANGSHGQGNDYVMIVYCDDRDNEEVERILRERLEVGRMDWKHDRDTLLEMLERGDKIPLAFVDGLRELGDIE